MQAATQAVKIGGQNELPLTLLVLCVQPLSPSPALPPSHFLLPSDPTLTLFLARSLTPSLYVSWIQRWADWIRKGPLKQTELKRPICLLRPNLPFVSARPASLPSRSSSSPNLAGSGATRMISREIAGWSRPRLRRDSPRYVSSSSPRTGARATRPVHALTHRRNTFVDLQGRNIVVDRTNFDAQQRAHWLRLANASGREVRRWCLFCTSSCSSIHPTLRLTYTTLRNLRTLQWTSPSPSAETDSQRARTTRQSTRPSRRTASSTASRITSVLQQPTKGSTRSSA